MQVIEEMDEVLDSMRQAPRDAETQWKGCEAVWRIAMRDWSNAMLMRMGAAEVIREAMVWHAEDEEVCEMGCAAFASLAGNVGSQGMLMQVGVVDVILNAMVQHVDNPGLCQYGCAGFKSLAVSDDENKVALVEMGALGVIIKVLVMHADNARVCEKSCEVLQSLLLLRQNCAALMLRRIQPILMQVAKNHPKNAEIQSLCQCILTQLSKYLVDKSTLSIEKAVDVLVRAFEEQHLENVVIVCEYFAEHADLLEKAMIGLIMRAMKTVPEAQLPGLCAIKAFAEGHPDAGDTLKELSTIEALCGASRRLSCLRHVRN